MTKHNTVTLTGLSLCLPRGDPDYVCLTISDLVGGQKKSRPSVLWNKPVVPYVESSVRCAQTTFRAVTWTLGTKS